MKKKTASKGINKPFGAVLCFVGVYRIFGFFYENYLFFFSG